MCKLRWEFQINYRTLNSKLNLTSPMLSYVDLDNAFDPLPVKVYFSAKFPILAKLCL